MKKLILLLLFTVTLVSCSKEEDCEFRGERDDELIEELTELQEKRDNAEGQVRANYELQIKQVQQELDAELKICD